MRSGWEKSMRTYREMIKTEKDGSMAQVGK
jgi:hypothetical protein